MKKLRFFLVIFGLFTLLNTSCKSHDETSFIVSFDTSGGVPVPEDQILAYGEKVIQPAIPKREGYDFDGWHKDSANSELWVFEKDVVNKDITLFAKWVNGEDSGNPGTGKGKASGTRAGQPIYTITIQDNGNGTANSSLNTAGQGVTVTIDAVPDAGYEFVGWQAVSGGAVLSSLTAVSSSFIMPANDVTIKAFFALQGPRNIMIYYTGPAAITPMRGAGMDEREASFNITIPQLYSWETVTVGLISPLPCISPVAGTVGSAGGTVKLVYDGSTPVSLPNPLDFPLTVSPGFNLVGSPVVNVEVYDGQNASRAIPVTKSNIRTFNVYATNATTYSEGLALHYALMENIDGGDLRTDLGAGNNWEAIGYFITFTDNLPFTGSFDGKGHSVSGLEIEINNITDTKTKGFFGYIANSGTTIKNFSLLNVKINAPRSFDGVAGVVGYCDSNCLVENCYVTGTVKGRSNVGAIIGNCYGTVRNCYSTASVSAVGINDRDVRAGGIVGLAEPCTMENCYATGPITVYTVYSDAIILSILGANAGGLAGYIIGNPQIRNNMALNLRVESTRSGSSTSEFNSRRIVGYSLNPLTGLSGNFARVDMVLDPSPDTGDPLHTLLNGTGINTASAKTRTAWDTAGFLFTDSTPTAGPWTWTGTYMPSLHGETIPWPF